MILESLSLTFNLALVVSASLVAQELYEFPNSTWIENIAIRPNGQLLLTSISFGGLFVFDPHTDIPGIAIQIPDASSVTGIAEVYPDEFVVAAGDFNATTGAFLNVAFAVVKFCGSQATLKSTLPAPDSGLPNGIAALPARPGVALVADSAGGRILRVDTTSGNISTVLVDPSLLPAASGIPGVNGIKILGAYLYYTSSATGVLGRVPVSADGWNFGVLETITTLATPGEFFDDFAMGSGGVVYASVHPNTVQRIWTNGTQEVVVGGDSTLLKVPTSVALKSDEKLLFVTTAGTTTSNGTIYGGQVVQISI